jgi:hypothetical protein
MTVPVLSLRALNRATLARQLLLERSALEPVAALEHLVGLQSQTPQTWYTGLWSRLADFDAAAFGALLESREVVRMALMRSTIHLVSASDSLFLRPLVQPVTERGARAAYGKRWVDLDLQEVGAVARALLEPAPLSFAELGAALRERWPDRDGAALAQAARTVLALVQTPPRGVWGKSGLAKHSPAESWLGRPLESAPSIETMVLRYLGAFGPASVRDVQAWSGLTRLSEVVERLRSGLLVFRDENGRELFDLPDAPRPSEETPAPVRFLYDFDNLLLSHADRARVISFDPVAGGGIRNGQLPNYALVDGFVRASWRLGLTRALATLTIAPVDRLRAAEVTALRREGSALLGFLAADRPEREILFAD